MTATRFQDTTCAVCARPAVGYGYAPSARQPIAWVCDDDACLKIIKDTYAMAPREFQRIDDLATKEGGMEAGAYLDELGRTDLGALSEEEYDEYCRRMVGGYRHALQTTLRNAAPF